MRIGIDAHHLNGKPQGSRTYLLSLVAELAHMAPEERYVIYSFLPGDTKRMLDAPNLEHRRIFPESARLRLPLVLPALELFDGLDLFHSQYICPPISAIPEVVTIHDILFETHPDLFVGAFSPASVWLIRRSARRARFVLTVSEFSRKAIIERYGLPENKVLVTPNGVDRNRFNRSIPEQELEELKKRYDLLSPFLLCVGRLEPRKNLERLIRAFARLHSRRAPDFRLVLAGQKDYRFESIFREAEKLPSGMVRFLGPVADRDLPALYNLAHGLAFPSLVEGFGMPVLESMACGTPVMASRRGALPEVGGDGVLWVEPEDEDSILHGLEMLCTDRELRTRLTESGLERAANFGWKGTARRTLEVYHKCRKTH